ncbi:hypothetical protein [Arcticibacter sp. MXS-1]|uniref:hypothetical protein n=1 Tax=Arcticibacter sp. MXS-1 TaxID=3341726 RepID=UPI0035A8AEC6
MKLFLVVLLLFAFNCVFAQNSYQQDLDFLYQAAKKLPAYHDQVRGKEKAAYDKLYTQLRSREVGKSVVDTFTVLSSLLWPFKDKHLAFWMPLRNESDAISIMPFVAEDLDSLKNVLKHSPRDSVEGIYHAGKQMLVGIYRTTTKDSLNCVVLESQAKAFSPGQLLGTLFQCGGDSFRMILVDPQSRSLLYSPGVRVTHGRFHVCDLRKEVEPSHSEFWPGEPYRFRKIGPNTAYLYLGTFYSSDENLKRASAFAESIKDSLISDHLIVDIRGNMGGETSAPGSSTI